MSIHRQRKITAHISPYLGGLASETHQFVAYLNEEAAQHKTRVRFVATANRIEAIGNLKRAATSTTLGGWLLRRAITAGYLEYEKRPVWWLDAKSRQQLDRQTDIEIESERSVLRRGNSQHRRKLRKWEKNRRVGADTLDPWRDRWRRRNLVIDHRGRKLMPAERTELAELIELVRLVRSGEKLLSPPEVLELKVNLAAETLYHLIDAIPVAERDRQEIYPGDFLRAVISEPLPEKMWLPGLGLRDYSEPALLLFKGGRYGRVIRQKAASVARPIASDTPYSLLLVPTQTQRVLECAGRLYKNSCWFPQLDRRRRLFDKCQASSYRKLQAFKGERNPHKRVEEFDAYRLEVTERWQAVANGVVDILIPGMPRRHVAAKRHAALAASRDSYNAENGSYWNGARMSRLLRQGGEHGRGSLNIPRETIEARNNMVDQIKDDFDRDKREVA